MKRKIERRVMLNTRLPVMTCFRTISGHISRGRATGVLDNLFTNFQDLHSRFS